MHGQAMDGASRPLERVFATWNIGFFHLDVKEGAFGRLVAFLMRKNSCMSRSTFSWEELSPTSSSNFNNLCSSSSIIFATFMRSRMGTLRPDCTFAKYWAARPSNSSISTRTLFSRSTASRSFRNSSISSPLIPSVFFFSSRRSISSQRKLCSVSRSFSSSSSPFCSLAKTRLASSTLACSFILSSQPCSTHVFFASSTSSCTSGSFGES
mmetsp:Transcript_732/g.4637  ORF Transcript_732/g.4637 Transcript_732/m.4637 type:complete len:210 (+) Transcript_732:159-788(+)